MIMQANSIFKKSHHKTINLKDSKYLKTYLKINDTHKIKYHAFISVLLFNYF